MSLSAVAVGSTLGGGVTALGGGGQISGRRIVQPTMMSDDRTTKRIRFSCWDRGCCISSLRKDERGRRKGDTWLRHGSSFILRRSSFVLFRSPAVAQPVAQEVFQVGDRVDLFDGRFDVVLDPTILYGFAVEQDIARPPVAVARLADRADVAQRLAVVELVDVFDLFGAVELVQLVALLLGEDAGDVGVPLEAVAIDQGEDALHLALVVDVLREDVLVEGVAGRAVDVEETVFLVEARPLGEELPALLLGGAVLAGGLQLGPGPEDGLPGGRVEA